MPRHDSLDGSVAHSFFSDAVQMASAEQTSAIVDTCVFIHQSVERKSKDFYEELRRCASASFVVSGGMLTLESLLSDTFERGSGCFWQEI